MAFHWLQFHLFKSNNYKCRAGCGSVAMRRLRQEDREFKASRAAGESMSQGSNARRKQEKKR